MMDYKKAYYSLIERLKEAKEDDVLCDERYCCVIDELIKEPEECEDERMRDALIRAFKSLNTIKVWNGIELNNIITWLEKQGNKPKQTSIWKHWKDGIAGNGEGEPIYLVKNGNTYSLNSCLGCECDYIELSDLDKLMLEKQGEQKPALSKEDEAGLGDALWAIQQARTIAKDENDMGNLWYAENWLNSLKEKTSEIMRVTGLMLGSYVSVVPSGMMIKVVAIHKDKVAYHATPKKLEWVKMDLLRPIPLTEEILEKNGFRKSVSPPGIHAKCYEIDDKDKKYHLTIANYNKYKRLLLNVDSEYSECFNIKCDYVHQLQQALRLCGITREIII